MVWVAGALVVLLIFGVLGCWLVQKARDDEEAHENTFEKEEESFPRGHDLNIENNFSNVPMTKPPDSFQYLAVQQVSPPSTFPALVDPTFAAKGQAPPINTSFGSTQSSMNSLTSLQAVVMPLMGSRHPVSPTAASPYHWQGASQQYRH